MWPWAATAPPATTTSTCSAKCSPPRCWPNCHSEDAAALPAADALAMATINGARALGLEDRIGSLEIGKLADMIAVDLSQPETQPLYNPLSQLVYACNGSQVTHSWIDGVPVYARAQTHPY